MEPEKKGYGSNWKRYIWIYVVVGAIAYLLIYLIFFRGGGYGS